MTLDAGKGHQYDNKELHRYDNKKYTGITGLGSRILPPHKKAEGNFLRFSAQKRCFTDWRIVILCNGISA